MAKIKFGMMMTDARGKLGGQVFSKNRSGAYIRTKVTPVNPRTDFQQANRSLLGSLSSGWSTLTEAQRNAWNGAVEQWQKTNVFGDLQKPTGKNLFTSLNKVALANFADAVLLLTPPAKVEFPAITIESGSITASNTAILITFNGAELQGSSIQVRATPPVSAGTSYVTNLLRSIGPAFEVTEGNFISTGLSYRDRFGTITVGQKIFVEVRQVAVNGQLGVPMIYELIAIA